MWHAFHLFALVVRSIYAFDSIFGKTLVHKSFYFYWTFASSDCDNRDSNHQLSSIWIMLDVKLEKITIT